MSGGVELRRVERVLTGVAFEVSDRVQDRTDERRRIGLAEWSEEWHVAASGFVTGAADFVSADATIEFSMDFFDSPSQRNADLLTPTFLFGSYQAADTNFVVLTAAVREWTMRLDQAYIGAVVSIGVFMPGALGTTTFDVTAHLCFTGWGAPTDVETDETDTDPGP